MPGALVLTVEVGPVGVGQQDGVAAIANAASVAVAAVQVAGVAGAALVSDGEAVRANSPGSAQAPDFVVASVRVTLVFQGEAAVQLGFVAVEVKGQRLLLWQGQHVVDVDVLLLQHVLHVGRIQRGGQAFGEFVATTDVVDAFQAAAVATFGALASFLGEVTRVQLQTGDLFGHDRGALEGFRQQTRVVVFQDRNGWHLLTVFDHGVGDARLDGCAALGQVFGSFAAVTLLEEVDTAGAAAAFATVQAQRVLADHVHTHTDSALGEAGLELADEALAPFSFVLLAVFVVTADVSVAYCDVQVAVFNKTLGLLLVVSHCLSSAQNPQSDQTHPLLQHFLYSLLLFEYAL